MQQLKPADYQRSRLFADWSLEMSENVPEFYRKIIFIDKAHCPLGGFINKQNCHIWGSENLTVFVKKRLNPPCVTVWSGAIIGPYFLANQAEAKQLR